MDVNTFFSPLIERTTTVSQGGEITYFSDAILNTVELDTQRVAG